MSEAAAVPSTDATLEKLKSPKKGLSSESAEAMETSPIKPENGVSSPKTSEAKSTNGTTSTANGSPKLKNLVTSPIKSTVESADSTTVSEVCRKSPQKNGATSTKEDSEVESSGVEETKNGAVESTSVTNVSSETSSQEESVSASSSTEKVSTKNVVENGGKVSPSKKTSSPQKQDVDGAPSSTEKKEVPKTSENVVKKGVSPVKKTSSPQKEEVDGVSSTEDAAVEPKTSPGKTDKAMPDDSTAKSCSPSKDSLDGNAKFLRGKRDYLIGDYAAAVTQLGEACELLTEKYGELADEMGDVFLYYGKALFANARSASGVLGDKIDKETETVEEEDEEDEGEEGDEQEEESKEDTEKTTAAESQPEEASEKSEAVSSNTQEAGQEEGAAEGEDVDDLQLSWEMLEMAKVIYSRKADSDKQAAIKLSEVYLSLGENGIESESYTTAVADMQTCLELQKKNLESDDRRIAETLYQIGVAHSTAENYDDAISFFNQSVAQLSARLESLDKAKSAGLKHPAGEERDSFYTIDGEISEVNDVIKEIKEKVTDMVESKKQMKEQMAQRLAEGLASASSDGASTSSAAAFSSSPVKSADSKPVSNISHLVRKKRPNDEATEDSAAKKVKTDEKAEN